MLRVGPDGPEGWMSRSFEDSVRMIAAATQPAWLWDAARRRVAFANQAAIAHFGEATLDDLLDHRFGPDEATARMAGEAATLSDGRAGLIVIAGAPPAKARLAPADLFGAAPAALAVFDVAGQRLVANAEANELLLPGELGIVFSSPYVAADFLKDIEARGALVKKMNDMLTKDSNVIIPLVDRGRFSAQSNSIDGFIMNSWDSELWNVADWSRVK